jgi:hypothetical protein
MVRSLGAHAAVGACSIVHPAFAIVCSVVCCSIRQMRRRNAWLDSGSRTLDHQKAGATSSLAPFE